MYPYDISSSLSYVCLDQHSISKAYPGRWSAPTAERLLSSCMVSSCTNTYALALAYQFLLVISLSRCPDTDH
jgi:hypothetical protein